MSLHKDVILFVDNRLDDIFKRPEMWGTQDIIEHTVLNLLEFRSLASNTEKMKSDKRFVLDRYVTYLTSFGPYANYLGSRKLEMPVFIQALDTFRKQFIQETT